MNSSDWLQIVLSIVGFLGGAALSFVFFRTQQVLDFNRLNESIKGLAHDISELKRDKTLETKLEDMGTKSESNELKSISTTLESIQNKLNETVIRILNDIKSEQAELRKSLQEKYEGQSKDAIRVIERALRQELDRVLPVPEKREEVIENMTRLIEQAFIQLGKYQRLNIERQSSSTLSVLEEKVIVAINEVGAKVQELQKTTETLMSLPAPNADKSDKV